jgi:hypothetical protein
MLRDVEDALPHVHEFLEAEASRGFNFRALGARDRLRQDVEEHVEGLWVLNELSPAVRYLASCRHWLTFVVQGSSRVSLRSMLV